MLRSILSAALIFCTSSLFAQSVYTENTLKLDDPTNMPDANIDDVAWLSGNWVAEAFGGLAEDIWSDPAGGSMVGLFRSVSGGEVNFYEIFTISEIEESLILRLKHFNADLTGWEEKNVTQDFQLVEISDQGVWFEGFTILKKGSDAYQVFLAMKSPDGEVAEMEFNFSRRTSKK